jgi:hypothetical protein
MMMRPVLASALSTAMVLNTPVFAITAQEKMATCKFGADDQKLAGAARKTFIARCMADEPASSKSSDQKK